MKTWVWALVFVLTFPTPILAFHDGSMIPHGTDSICFNESGANKILKTLEDYDGLILDVSNCEGLIVECENLVSTCNEQLEWNSNEILVLIEQRDEGIRMLEDAQKAAKIAKKGTWWERAKSNSKWLGYGAIIGGAIILAITK